MSIRIIGAGHVGSQISSQLNIEGTKRSGDLCFDSNDLSTYDTLNCETLIITFALGKESEFHFKEFKKHNFRIFLKFWIKRIPKSSGRIPPYYSFGGASYSLQPS